MKLYVDLEECALFSSTSITLGTFDGVHKGHQALIKANHAVAKKEGLLDLVVTYWPHPQALLEPEKPLHLLSTLEERLEHIARSGASACCILPFDKELSKISYSKYFEEVLQQKLKAQVLVLGFDHHFGANRTGGFQEVSVLAEELNVRIIQQEPIHVGDERISSTSIRRFLQLGKVLEAESMLGYMYTLSGEVVEGEKVGRRLGYPTANIKVPGNKLVPMDGVYICTATIAAESYKAVVSIGNKPTYGGKGRFVEAYLLNFARDIYGIELKLDFQVFVRPQLIFATEQALVAQIEQDVNAARSYFKI